MKHRRLRSKGAGGEGGGRGDRDGEDMWTQGLFISMYDKIYYKKKKNLKKFKKRNIKKKVNMFNDSFNRNDWLSSIL